MPYSGDVRQEVRLDKVEQAIFGTQLIHVKTTIEIVARDEESQLPTLVESRPDLDLLIDPADGTRSLRHESADPDAWDELAADAQLIHVPITCYEKQLDIILDDHSRVVGIVCGSRAGKTHVVALRLFRRWMLRGGPGHEFWWVAPSWKQTEIGVGKLFAGDGKDLPIFPPELVLYYPKDQHQTKQYGELIDGSRIPFYQAGGKGGNLKGWGPYDIFGDEIAEIRHRENWTILINRLTSKDGTIAVATTPVAGHWSRADIVSRAQYSDSVSHYTLSIFDNPWEHPDVIRELIEALGGKDDPVVRREFYGEWLASSAALWPDWNPEEHLIQGHDFWTVEDLIREKRLPKHYQDLTDRAAAEFWRGHRGARVLIGQDFNVNPCSSVMARVFGDPNDRSTWGLFVFDELLTRGNIQNHSDKLASVRRSEYAGAPISVDSTGAKTGTHPSQGATGSSTNCSEMRRFGFDAKACQKYRGNPFSPRQIDSLNLCYRLQRRGRILVHERAAKLCEALDNQERTYDGKVAKEPSTAADRLSGPSDALRYLLWPLFKQELKNKVGKYGEAKRADRHMAED